MQYRSRKVHIFLTSSLYIILLGYIKQGFVFILKPWESYYLYVIADESAHLKEKMDTILKWSLISFYINKFEKHCTLVVFTYQVS